MTGSGGAQSSLDRVYTVLADGGFHPSRRGTDFKALCPVHEERTGSLHVTWKAGNGHDGGQVVLHCFGCNATAEAITERLGLSMADLYDEPLPPSDESSPRNPLSRVGRTARSRKQGTVRGKSGRLPARVVKRPQPPDEPQHRWEVTARYPYVDLDGTLVQEAWRRTCTSCPIPHKTFTQRYPDPRDGALVDRQPPGWVPVLYRWPEVHTALLALQTVWVVEGEKDADNAAALGVAATTNPNGGRAFPDPCAEVLAGGTVHVVLDRDDTGWARGLRLHEQLSGVGCTVRLFLPATLDAKSDLSDHLQAGHTLEQLGEVSVAEVACWHYLEPVTTAVKGVEECRAEAVERLARAEAARDAEDVAAAEQESGFAARWATAAVVRWETLSDDVTRLAGAAQSAGTAWAAEAATVGVSLLRRAGKVVAEIHERAQLTLPSEVATHLLGPRAERVVTAAPGQKVTGRADRGAPRIGGQYELIGGELWQRGERPRRLLNLDVQIEALEYAVDGGDDKLDQVPLQGRDSRAGITAVRNHRTATNVIFRWTSPLTGEVERERVELDAAKKSDWLADLSIPGLTYSSTSGGRAQVWDAIRSTSLDWTGEDLHDATGWHHFDKFGWGWVHAGGAITAKGNQPLGVVLEGRLGNFDLPDPVHDEVVVGAAFRSHTLPLLTRLPARVTAPLVGHMMRAVLGRHPWTPVVIGPKGSIKTGVAALVQSFYGEAWDRDRPLASMSGNGDTDNALRQKLHRCKDAVGFLDDVAPTKDIPTAQAHMENVARTIHNNEERARSTRDGQGMHGGRPPRGSAVITSEVWPAPGSGADRLMPLPITRNDIPLAAVLELDSADSRYGRAMLMSSLISWIAGDLPGLRQQMRSTVAAVAQRLRAAGRETRQAEAYAGAWSGWVLLLDFLVDTEAITVAEASSIRQQVWAGLGQAMNAALDPDMPLTRAYRISPAPPP